MSKLQKGILGAAAALAFSGSSAVYGAGTILFDPTGSAGAGIAVDTFDWSPGNALGVGALSTAPVNGSVTFQLVAQGRLGTFIQPGGGLVTAPAGTEFTFQVAFSESAVGLGTSGISLTTQPALISSFAIYRDTVIDSNPITGTGFGASGTSTLILHGTLVGGTGVFNDNTIGSGLPNVLLDGLNADNQNGTLTHQGNGSTTVQVNVDFQNNSFFRSNVSSLVLDLQDTTNNAVPFLQTDPSDQLFNSFLGLAFTPSYSLNAAGQRVNLDTCSPLRGGQTETGAPSTRCDIHLQTDAATSFNPTAVPEPGMLALLGLALGAVGVSRRGRARG